MDTSESLRKKIDGAEDLKSVVRTMKTMAASNIGQFEMAVKSLEDYNRTVKLGFIAYLRDEKINAIIEKKERANDRDKSGCIIVFGSDQGLVGKFNTSLVDFVIASLNDMSGEVELWSVGERIQLLFSDKGMETRKLFSVPNSVGGITTLVEQLLANSEESLSQEKWSKIHIYYNQPRSKVGYEPVSKQLLPLDQNWRRMLKELIWPTDNLPEIIGTRKTTLLALIDEYLFITLFKAMAESMASENASRLAAMQRAEKSIDKLIDELTRKFHHMRQNAIDEELFDILSGFEALRESVKNEAIQ